MAELSGPRRLALDLVASIERLEAERALLPKAERKAINQKLHMQRYMLRWCKTRRGYV